MSPREIPMLFSAPMVRAILSGAKTQTRRVLTHPHADEIDAWAQTDKLGYWDGGVHEAGNTALMCTLRCPFGAPGDLLWVRETWAPCEAPIRKGSIQYAADGAVGLQASTNGGESWWARNGHTVGISDEALIGTWIGRPSRWKPSIHMPKKFARIWLQIESVKVERVCDISAEDAIAEGTRCCVCDWSVDGTSENDCSCFHTKDWAIPSFKVLWESVYPGTWGSWCWAISFRKVESKEYQEGRSPAVNPALRSGAGSGGASGGATQSADAGSPKHSECDLVARVMPARPRESRTAEPTAEGNLKPERASAVAVRPAQRSAGDQS